MPTDQKQIQYKLAGQRMAESNLDSKAKRAQELENQLKAGQIGWALFGFLVIIAAAADILDLVLGGTFSTVIGWAVDAIMLISMGISKAGRNQLKKRWEAWLAGIGIESLPVLSFITARTPLIIYSFVKSRKEKRKLEVELSALQRDGKRGFNQLEKESAYAY